jgi:hypothetical protein
MYMRMHMEMRKCTVRAYAVYAYYRDRACRQGTRTNEQPCPHNHTRARPSACLPTCMHACMHVCIVVWVLTRAQATACRGTENNARKRTKCAKRQMDAHARTHAYTSSTRMFYGCACASGRALDVRWMCSLRCERAACTRAHAREGTRRHACMQMGVRA